MGKDDDSGKYHLILIQNGLDELTITKAVAVDDIPGHPGTVQVTLWALKREEG